MGATEELEQGARPPVLLRVLIEKFEISIQGLQISEELTGQPWQSLLPGKGQWMSVASATESKPGAAPPAYQTPPR